MAHVEVVIHAAFRSRLAEASRFNVRRNAPLCQIDTGWLALRELSRASTRPIEYLRTTALP